MNTCHFNIKLPIPFIPYSKVFDTFKEIPLKKILVNREFIHWLALAGLTFNQGRFFNSPPNIIYDLHVDGKQETDCVKLNLVFDSTDTKMNWYEPFLGYAGTLQNNTVGEPILYFDKNKCNVLHTAPVNTHCIINGNIVHDLVNGPNNGQSRKCYSLILINFKTHRRLKWEEAVEILNPYLID